MYYIYAYLRTNGTPYYIGKGKGRRAWGKQHKVPVPKDKNRIVIMEANLTEIGAWALERFYIRWYGRVNKGTGILLNTAKGGTGGHSKKGINKGPKSEKAKQSMRGLRPHVNQTGYRNNNARPIYTPYGAFGSMTDASRKLGVHYDTIWWKINRQKINEGWGYV